MTHEGRGGEAGVCEGEQLERQYWEDGPLLITSKEKAERRTRMKLVRHRKGTRTRSAAAGIQKKVSTHRGKYMESKGGKKKSGGKNTGQGRGPRE